MAGTGERLAVPLPMEEGRGQVCDPRLAILGRVMRLPPTPPAVGLLLAHHLVGVGEATIPGVAAARVGVAIAVGVATAMVGVAIGVAVACGVGVAIGVATPVGVTIAGDGVPTTAGIPVGVAAGATTGFVATGVGVAAGAGAHAASRNRVARRSTPRTCSCLREFTTALPRVRVEECVPAKLIPNRGTLAPVSADHVGADAGAAAGLRPVRRTNETLLTSNQCLALPRARGRPRIAAHRPDSCCSADPGDTGGYHCRAFVIMQQDVYRDSVQQGCGLVRELMEGYALRGR